MELAVPLTLRMDTHVPAQGNPSESHVCLGFGLLVEVMGGLRIQG